MLRELWKRENEREQRDREFWMTMFGGDKGNSRLFEDEDVSVSVKDSAGNVLFSEDQIMARSPLGSR